MPPQLWYIRALGVLLGEADNRTSNAEETGYRRYTCITSPPVESLGCTNGPLRSSGCVNHNDTALEVPVRIPKFDGVEVAVSGWDLLVSKPLIVILHRCSISH